MFCEWAYVIDLQKGTFEVYEGFQKEPISEDERFYSFFEQPEHRTDAYYPVKKVKEWKLLFKFVVQKQNIWQRKN